MGDGSSMIAIASYSQVGRLYRVEEVTTNPPPIPVLPLQYATRQSVQYQSAVPRARRTVAALSVWVGFAILFLLYDLWSLPKYQQIAANNDVRRQVEFGAFEIFLGITGVLFGILQT